MREATQYKTITEVPVNDIHADDRLRPVSETAVEALIASITQIGVMKDPVMVRKVKHQDGRLVLIAGAHRLEAAKRLGWTNIPASVWDCSDDWARLVEIDDNLAHAELDPLELAVFLAERKVVYERMYPESRAGVKGGLTRLKGDTTDIMSFVQSVAEKRSLSERHIRRFVHIGETLTKRDIAALRTRGPAIKMKDLLDIVKMPDPKIRAEVIFEYGHGEFKSLDQARKVITGETRPEKPHKEKMFENLITAWGRVNNDQKRQFLQMYGEEITELLGDDAMFANFTNEEFAA